MIELPGDAGATLRASEFYETRPKLFEGALSRREFAWRDMDTILHGIEPEDPLVRLIGPGRRPLTGWSEQVFEQGLSRKRLRRDILASEMQRGATLALSRAELRSTYVRDLCRAVSHAFGDKAVANLYCTTATSEGSFGPHYDTHDVLAVQLLGEKRWRIAPPSVEKPFRTQRSNGAEPQDIPWTHDIRLRAGDALYIPRGWWHHVTPDFGPTVHVAVGIHPVLVLDYLQWLITQAAPSRLPLRRQLADMDAAAMQEVQRALAELVASPEHQAAYQRYVIELERTETGSFFERLDAVIDARPLGGEVRVNSSYDVAAAAGVKSLAGSRLGDHPAFAEILKRAAQASWIAVGDLAAGDVELALLERMIDADLLEWRPTEQAGGATPDSLAN